MIGSGLKAAIKDDELWLEVSKPQQPLIYGYLAWIYIYWYYFHESYKDSSNT